MFLRGIVAVVSAGVVAVAYVFLDNPRIEGRAFNGSAEPTARTLALAPLSLGNPAAAATLRTQSPRMPRDTAPRTAPYSYTLRVGPGDVLGSLLNEAGIGQEDVRSTISALAKVYNPRRIRPGQNVTLTFRPGSGNDEADRFQGLALGVDYARRVVVERTDGGRFSASEVERPLRRRYAVGTGTIRASLFVDATRAGVPTPVVAELVRAYSWDVDFQRDIHPGDGFQVMYERFFDDRVLVHNGGIVHAVLTLRGKSYPIYRHTTEDGLTDYFNDRGHSARKALMRTPIDGARLSSRYGMRRHPILGYSKMHRGLDFAAPTGTPIYAAGDGTVVTAGRNGAYGKYVRIRHNGRYSTAYAHLSRYGKGIRRGRRVHQGRIIGYVGTTGRSTGPHLHYEILVDGRRFNPLRVKMPSGRKLKGDELARFQATRKEIDTRYAVLAYTDELAKSEE